MCTVLDPLPIVNTLFAAPAVAPVIWKLFVIVPFAALNVLAVSAVSSGNVADTPTCKWSTVRLLDDRVVELALIPVLENITLLVLAKLISSPTVRSPDVLASVNAAAHLAVSAPNAFPLALGNIFVSTSATNDTVSVAASPRSTDPLNVAKPSTVNVLSKSTAPVAPNVATFV